MTDKPIMCDDDVIAQWREQAHYWKNQAIECQAEIERLRDENARLRAVVEAVAGQGVHAASGEKHDENCSVCKSLAHLRQLEAKP